MPVNCSDILWEKISDASQRKSYFALYERHTAMKLDLTVGNWISYVTNPIREDLAHQPVKRHEIALGEVCSYWRVRSVGKTAVAERATSGAPVLHTLQLHSMVQGVVCLEMCHKVNSDLPAVYGVFPDRDTIYYQWLGRSGKMVARAWVRSEHTGPSRFHNNNITTDAPLSYPNTTPLTDEMTIGHRCRNALCEVTALTNRQIQATSVRIDEGGVTLGFRDGCFKRVDAGRL